MASSTLVTAPATITFPSFLLSDTSDAGCGTVTQALDTSSIPSYWVVTYSDTGDNSIQIPTLLDINDAKDYTITFTAFIGGCAE